MAKHIMIRTESRFLRKRETVRRVHKGGTRGPSAKSDGLTVTEDDVQIFVRHVVLLVWVGGGSRCWIATGEEEGIL